MKLGQKRAFFFDRDGRLLCEGWWKLSEEPFTYEVFESKPIGKSSVDGSSTESAKTRRFQLIHSSATSLRYTEIPWR